MNTFLSIVAAINYVGSAIALLMSWSTPLSNNGTIVSAIMFLVAIVATIGSDIIQSLNYLVKCAAQEIPTVDQKTKE